jgi:copper chaperone CopZ
MRREIQMKSEITVGGMTCDSCVNAATQALDAVDGVQKVKVDLKSGKATVKHDDSVSEADLKAAVTAIGFTSD